MIRLDGVKAVVTDIEGTTSSISFVHDVLFPYARQRMGDFVRSHIDQIQHHLESVRDEIGEPDMTAHELVSVLIRWIDEDRKATPLKAIQGMIWKEGFENGDFKGHVYPDAVVGLKRWHDAGLKLYVYSSGSIGAQKLLFGYSEAGDLNRFFSGNFDTITGGKKEAESYRKITAELGFEAQEIVFLSDVVSELEAAEAAGLQTVLLDRGNEHPETIWPNKTKTFDDIQLT
ncbi:MAG: acireductone synthase [Ponticaulis sp.]|nr:acireductone synthase [Ponticaulis sp.]|tara:strand:- start:20615 stop:21304 length:690 start_codon:yes stop_codon:yes gene_type:complete